MEQSYPQPSPSQPTATPSGLQRLSDFLPSISTLKVVASFAARRLAFGAAVLIAIIFLTYLGFGLVQGTGFIQSAGQAVNQTASYLVNLAHGELGISLSGSIAFRRMPVAELLPNVVLRSLGLLGATFLLSIAVGVPLGSWAAARRYSKKALLLVLASIVGIATPSFFAALFLQIAAITYTRYAGHSIVPVGGFGWDKHIILPMLVLAARPVAQITRITYVSVSEIYDQDYIRTAHSKGVRADAVFWVHILRNAAVPILTTIAVSLRFALSSLPVVEVYFGWGGMGQTLLNSIFNGDSDLTIALFLILGLLFISVNLLLEISYTLIDPRLGNNNTHERYGDSVTMLGALKSVFTELRDFLWYNPVVKWVRQHAFGQELESTPFLNGQANPQDQQELPASGDNSRWRAWRRGLLGNLPLAFGAILVTGLILLTLFGPRLAPYSPNTTQLIAYVDGVLTTPPFPPSELHPWGTDPIGRDMLSLILAGVQQTVILALAVVGARLIIGFVLGVLAGWFPDSWLDRLIVGLTQAIAVFPTLLLAALLIFIIGIQNGMKTFVIALSLVGWGEIMQFVRGEVMSVRLKPFIESAVAVGQRTSRLIMMHVLPNVAPALVSVAALEAGAVLLILGELGFLGIFIRGGAGSELGLYSQVPEWGALLSGMRTWTRSYPWTGFFPSLAFFVAVLGFTLLGEGLRQLIDEVGMVMHRLINPYTVGVSALIVAAFFWARGNTGELVFFRQQAETFSGANAMAHLQALSDPALGGRALGSPELASTADYIQDQFDKLGLQKAGESLTFLQSDTRTYQAVAQEPVLSIEDGGETPLYHQDFAIFPTAGINQGQAEGRLRLLARGEKGSFADLNLSEDIVLLLSEDDLPRLANLQCRGVLVVASEISEIKRRYTLSAEEPSLGCGQDTPVLWISDRLANRLVKGEQSYKTLAEQAANLGRRDILDVSLDIPVKFEIPATDIAQTPVVNVIGQLPGTNEQLDNKLIIVAAQYDSPPVDSMDFYPGANENASGVAVLLEAIRTLQESGYQPFKTYLFVAYSGEGLPDLARAPEVQSFLQARSTLSNAYEIENVIYLRGLGIGTEDTLAIWSEKKSDLAKLTETAVHLSGLKTERVQGPPSMNIYVPRGERQEPEPDYDVIGLSRLGWERSARLKNDTATFITTDELQKAGQAVSLALMILGR
jgi:peptide/nickel transport system permease protein